MVKFCLHWLRTSLTLIFEMGPQDFTKMLTSCQVLCFANVYFGNARFLGSVNLFGFHFDYAYYKAMISVAVGTVIFSSVGDRL